MLEGGVAVRPLKKICIELYNYIGILCQYFQLLLLQLTFFKAKYAFSIISSLFSVLHASVSSDLGLIAGYSKSL